MHRDIKPGNVMLCERGGIYDVAKLLDYGLVSVVRSTETDSKITQAGMIVGTPAFMSPEQCSEDSELTGASDIYSLGAVGHFLLTGKPPFGGRSAMQMLAAHLYEVPARLSDVRSDVPTGLSDVLAKCLEKSPTARFENMEALEGALLAVVLPDAWSDDDARAWWAAHQPEGEAAGSADDTRSVASLTRHLELSPQRHLKVDKALLPRHLDF